jgi:hypothetical protein
MDVARKYRMLCLTGVSAVALLAGCGGGDPQSGPTRAPGGGGGAGTMQDQMVAYARCMREQGVDMPDPDPNMPNRLTLPKGVDPQKLSAAQKACRGSAPQGIGGPEDTQQHDQMVAMARCLREHGVDVPDPRPGQPLRLPPGGSRDTKVQQAMQDCQRAAPTPSGDR